MPDKCPICLEELVSSICTITPCGHCFHHSCLKRLTEAHHDARHCSSSSRELRKLPRCPVCKHKSKKFVPLYLTFEKEDYAEAAASSSSSTSTSSLSPAEVVVTDYEDATEAVRALSAQNFQLQKNILELKSLSKDQSDLLLEVLPKFDSLESKLRQTSREKHLIQKQLLDVEAENADLISDWNTIEMKMQLLQSEKNELQKENTHLCVKRLEVDQKLVRAKRKRKRIEEALRNGFEDQRVQARELEEVKLEMVKSRKETNRLECLLKESRSEADTLRKKVNKLKKRCTARSASKASEDHGSVCSSGSTSTSSSECSSYGKTSSRSRVKRSMKLYKKEKHSGAHSCRTVRRRASRNAFFAV